MTPRGPTRGDRMQREESLMADAATITVWYDDPESTPPLDPIERAAPTLGAAPFATKIVDVDPAPPAQHYERGTPEFRYWIAADALRRGADFWGQLLPGQWQATF